MKRDEIRESLEKQLQLLFKASEKANVELLIMLSSAMSEVAATLVLWQ